MKTDYEITYSVEREQWELWKIKKVVRSINIKCIFGGSKKQCKEKLKEIKKSN